MTSFFAIFGSVTTIVIAILGLVGFKLKSTIQRRSSEIIAQYPNAQLFAKNASFFGQESAGTMQMRGNGILLVTDDALIFEMLLPRKQVIIPFKSIIIVETPKSFLGKSRFTPLVKVVFHSEHGLPDSVAWQVNNTDALVNLIHEKIEFVSGIIGELVEA